MAAIRRNLLTAESTVQCHTIEVPVYLNELSKLNQLLFLEWRLSIVSDPYNHKRHHKESGLVHEISLMLLQVLDACMKNCGEDFQSEVFTKSFMDAMKTIVKVKQSFSNLY